MCKSGKSATARWPDPRGPLPTYGKDKIDLAKCAGHNGPISSTPLACNAYSGKRDGEILRAATRRENRMKTLLDRFCRYVRIDTTAVENAGTYPSSPGQLELGRMLTEELRALGLRDAVQDEHGIVLATIPATVKHAAPTIAWIAHVDTSPETTGRNVQPIVHENYAGGDIVLPGDPSKAIRVSDNPELVNLKGKTLVTTDGTTLLGADDKAGVAVIMEAAAQLLARPELPHGPIRVCFTCDEEIGHGVDRDVGLFRGDLFLLVLDQAETSRRIDKGRAEDRHAFFVSRLDQ